MVGWWWQWCVSLVVVFGLRGWLGWYVGDWLAGVRGGLIGWDGNVRMYVCTALVMR